MFVWPTGWERTVVVEEVLYTFGVVVLVCVEYASNRPTALWRFRASTSNSSSGRSWPQTYTHMCHIDHTCAQQDIRVYEDDHF